MFFVVGGIPRQHTMTNDYLHLAFPYYSYGQSRRGEQKYWITDTKPVSVSIYTDRIQTVQYLVSFFKKIGIRSTNTNYRQCYVWYCIDCYPTRNDRCILVWYAVSLIRFQKYLVPSGSVPVLYLSSTTLTPGPHNGCPTKLFLLLYKNQS